MSGMSDQPTPQPMDVDSSSPAPSSPVTADTPKTNGANGVNGVPDGPAPPPHRYTKSPPPPTANYAATPEAATPPAEPPTIDAEEYKAAGNKFFKIKDYPRAIEEYSKGGCDISIFESRHYSTPDREPG
jgi:DnaJ family protein C protein 7